MADPYGWLRADLATMHRAGWYRAPRPTDGRAGPVAMIGGREVVQFASNDYLGLAGDERLIEAACQAARTWGAGATGSRLLSGEKPVHRELERTIAAWKETEDCLVFSSGYLANLGTIPALVGKRDLILADSLNHACLRSGAELSGAAVLDYPHGDCTALAHLLAAHRPHYRRCLICTDTIFSMDGDLIDLGAIVSLAEQWECMVLVDEAHATGVLGASGAGAVEQLGLTGRPLVQMGTLSKALGSLGGYVCGSAELIDYLRNRARSWIYTTGLSPADAAAACTAAGIARTDTERRSMLWRNIRRLRAGVAQLGLTVLPTDAAIVCIRVGDIAATVACAARLLEAGIFAPAIRPPTVPTSRIRFAVTAAHTDAMIDHLLAVLAEATAQTAASADVSSIG